MGFWISSWIYFQWSALPCQRRYWTHDYTPLAHSGSRDPHSPSCPGPVPAVVGLVMGEGQVVVPFQGPKLWQQSPQPGVMAAAALRHYQCHSGRRLQGRAVLWCPEQNLVCHYREGTGLFPHAGGEHAYTQTSYRAGRREKEGERQERQSLKGRSEEINRSKGEQWLKNFNSTTFIYSQPVHIFSVTCSKKLFGYTCIQCSKWELTSPRLPSQLT